MGELLVIFFLFLLLEDLSCVWVRELSSLLSGENFILFSVLF